MSVSISRLAFSENSCVLVESESCLRYQGQSLARPERA